MEHPVVVGVDGSDASLRALDWAVEEADRHDCPLRIVHGSRWERYERLTPPGGERPSGRVMAEHIVASAEQRAAVARPGIRATGEVVPRGPVETLLAEADTAFAVVVGSRGLGTVTGTLLGSVGLGVVGQATCPTVVVRSTPPAARKGPRQVLVGVGEDAEDSPALPFAFREADVRGWDLRAVWAWPPPGDDGPEDEAAELHARESLARAMRTHAASYEQVTIRQEAVAGTAQMVLLRVAADADLLVVGGRARHGLFDVELGLVNHFLLHHAPCPVAVVPRR